MLWRGSELRGYTIAAHDGEIGAITDLLFDDTDWTLRWGVADTGGWLSGRLVLIPTSAFGEPDVATRRFPVDLTRERVKDSPGVDTHAPVSRQIETDVYTYYGWTPYWAAGYAYAPTPPAAAAMAGFVPPAGSAGIVPPAAPSAPRPAASGAPEPQGDPDLRSIREVTGYYVHASDGDIGHIEEFLIEAGSWTIRYLVVDTRNWWPGRKVLLSPQWIRSIDWAEQQITVDLPRQRIKDAPEYRPTDTVDRAYEERLHGHYGHMPYWV